jgi:hypothetical protein
MRKVIVLEHISLDGVIQSPGGPDEDTSGGFAYGGWIAPYSDAILGTALRKQMNLPFDLLLGRTTLPLTNTESAQIVIIEEGGYNEMNDSTIPV